MEPTSAPTDEIRPAQATPPTTSTTPSTPGATDDHELLVEEISIDGMCGVY